MQLFSAPSNLDNYAAMWSWPMFSCWCDRWVLCQGYWHARNWLLPQVTGELGSDRGVMADRVVVTASVVHADLVPVAMMLTCKGGTCVLTGITPPDRVFGATDPHGQVYSNKQLKGALFGGMNPRADMPMLLSMDQSGALSSMNW
jgi:Zn-dependent alcohol dehydrogenase